MADTHAPPEVSVLASKAVWVDVAWYLAGRLSSVDRVEVTRRIVLAALEKIVIETAGKRESNG